jgi:hypothetical protein
MAFERKGTRIVFTTPGLTMVSLVMLHRNEMEKLVDGVISAELNDGLWGLGRLCMGSAPLRILQGKPLSNQNFRWPEAVLLMMVTDSAATIQATLGRTDFKSKNNAEKIKKYCFHSTKMGLVWPNR